MSYGFPRRPGILNALALFSFVLSVLNVVWIIVFGVIVALLGAASWLGGPIVGAVGSVLAVVFILVLLAQSLLSILLFAGAWKTWQGDPGGRSLHLAWAWITVVIDLIDLAVTAGIDGGAWVRLIYAGVVIVVMNRDDVRAYFEGGRSDALYAKPGPPDDWS